MKRRRLKRRIDVRLTASIPCFSGTEFYVYTYTKVDEHVMINKGGAWAAGVETSCIGILRLPLLFLLLGMFIVIGVEADGTHCRMANTWQKILRNTSTYKSTALCDQTRCVF